MTVAETSRKLGINIDGVYRLLYSGRLRGVKRDGVWHVEPESVEERMKSKKARQ
jgi:hypothetical protein